MPIAPQVNLETYSSREYTVTLTLPDISWGILLTNNNGGSTVTGSGSHSIKFVGTSLQVNIAMDNLKYEPPHNYVLTPFDIAYTQTDDNDTGTPLSNLFTGTLPVTLRNAHEEWNITSIQTLVEDTTATWNLGSITDLRADEIDPSLSYRILLILSTALSGTFTDGNFILDTGTTYEFIGTKLECNAALAAAEFTPTADFDSNFSITYYQYYLDGATWVPQTLPSVAINVQTTAHDEFAISNQIYNEDVTATWNLGSITDLAVGKTYRLRMTVLPADGYFIAPWVNTSGDIWEFTGTKAECNTELLAVNMVPTQDNDTDFTVTYQQQQMTDGLDQGTQILNITNNLSHNEFAITDQTFDEDVTATWNLGSITDLAVGKTYRLRMTVLPADGYFIAPWVNTSGDIWEFTGTKAECNTELLAVNMVPTQDNDTDFTVTYQQQQMTDGLDQGTQILNITNNLSHNEFAITATQTYDEDVTANWNMGTVDDLAVGKTYRLTLTASASTIIKTITNWTDLTGGVFRFTGTKTQCNVELANVEIIPFADADADLTITYQQQQMTDGLDHGTQLITVTNNLSHDEFVINTTFTYVEDVVETWNLGSVTDLAVGKSYTLTLTTSLANSIQRITNWTEGVDGTYTFTGTKAQCNAELSTVEVIPGADNFADFTITYQQQQDTDGLDQGTQLINVTNIGSSGEFTITATQSYVEDTVQTWNMGTVDDVAGGKTYTLTLTASAVNMIHSIANWTDQTGGVFTFTGTKAQCNAELSTVEVSPHHDNIADFTITYQQQQDTDALNQGTQLITVTNIGVNAEYSIITSHALTEDTTATWNLGSIIDLGADVIDTGILYRLWLEPSQIAAGTVTSTGWGPDVTGFKFEFIGTKLECNAALAAVEFTPTVDFEDDFTIIYDQYYLDGATWILQQTDPFVEIVISITTTAHNEFAITDQTFDEDVTVSWNLGSITDLAVGKSYRLRLELTPTDGYFVAPWVNTIGNQWEFTGTKAECNTELSGISFTSQADKTSAFNVTYRQYQITDAPEINQGTQIFNITNNLSHAEFSAPAAQTYVEDTSQSWNLGNTITDLAVGKTYTLTLTVPASDGIITNGATWTDQTGGVFTFTGTKAQCNVALTDVDFTPTADNIDNFTITYAQNQDTDNIAQGNTTFNITNIGVNAEFAITATQTYDEDVTANWNLGSITDLAVGKSYTLTLSCGTDLIDSITGWTPSGSTAWTFTGTKAQCNAELLSVEIVPSFDNDTDFTVTYSQQQDTDSIAQGTQAISVTNGLSHNEFAITSGQTYTTDTTATWNIGSNTDLAVGKDYWMKLSATAPIQGTLTNWTHQSNTTSSSRTTQPTLAAEVTAAAYTLFTNTNVYTRGTHNSAWSVNGDTYTGDSVTTQYDGSDQIGLIGDSANDLFRRVIADTGVYNDQITYTGSDTVAGDLFGYSIASIPVLDTIAIGAPGHGSSAGAVYVFKRTGFTYTQEQKLVSTDIAAGDEFGFSLDMTTDGTTSIIVGAPKETTSSTGGAVGAVYIFKRTETNTVLTGTIDATASTAVVGVGTFFTTELVVGQKILVSGETREVTAITDDTNLTVDTAFTDTANDTSPELVAPYWTQDQKIQASDKNTSGLLADDKLHFGHSVSVDQSRLLIGAPYASPTTNGEGQAYFFDKSAEADPYVESHIFNEDTLMSGYTQYGYNVKLGYFGRDVFVAMPQGGGVATAGSIAAYGAAVGTDVWFLKEVLEESVQSANFGSSITISPYNDNVLIGSSTAFEGKDYVWGYPKAWIFEGTQAECNAELATVEFVPVPLYSSAFTLTYKQVQTTDPGISRSTQGEATINITNV